MKRIPQRTCIACREIAGKRELVRLVRTVDGGVEVDVTGRKAGRGAYLCRSRQCWEYGLKSGRLEHALRVSLSGDNRKQLVSCGEELLSGADHAQGS